MAPAAAARADISIKLRDGSEATEQHVTREFQADGGWDIVLKALYNPGGESNYTISGTGGERINSITIDVPCWKNAAGVCAPAGSPVFVRVQHGDALGIQSIGRIIQTGDAETSVRWVEATGDIGEVIAEDIGEVHAGRDVIGPVIATTENNSVRGVFIVMAGRNVLGDVKAANGRLGMVYASGTIGLPGDPVRIESRYIFYELHSETAIYADVDTRVNGGNVGLWAFITPVFEGTIRAAQLPTNIYAGRAALVEVSERFAGTMLIGRTFDAAGGFMRLPLGGLEGQIIFNADNLAGVTWSNPIYFGASGEPGEFVLSGPGYTKTAAELGGGSIGLAPFALHDESCAPVNGRIIGTEDAGTDFAVRLRHYGPVTWTDVPVVIERRIAGSTGPFSTLSTLDFSMSAAPGDPNTIEVGPTSAGEGGFEGGYEYRLTPTPALRSDVTGLPPVGWEQPYLFTIEKVLCLGDTNGNQAIEVADLLLLLASWGPVGQFTTQVDLNGDGWVNVSDLLNMLSRWGPCP